MRVKARVMRRGLNAYEEKRTMCNDTNVRGHIVRCQYSPYDSLTFTVTCFLTDLINESPIGSESGTTRVQIDAVLKF